MRPPSSPITVAALLTLLPSALALSHAEDHELLHSGRPRIGLWQAIHRAGKSGSKQVSGSGSGLEFSPSGGGNVQVTFGKGGSEDNPAEDPDRYVPYCFTQPLDHFDPSNDVTFCQRYWVSLSRWNSSDPSAPIIILDGGETSGANRLAFLEAGIVDILSNATGGIGVILEHRYYGESVPEVSYPDHQPMTFSTDDLRWLNNEQAEMDNVRFLQGLDLSHLPLPPNTSAHSSTKSRTVGPALDFGSMRASSRPYIYYGGSYAGARSAHMIKGYGVGGDQFHTIPEPHPSIPWQNDKLPPAPSGGVIKLPGGSTIRINSTTGEGNRGLIWGAIASSAVTHAQVRYPEYFLAIQDWAPRDCMDTLETVIETIDSLLSLRSGILAPRVQTLFGLGDLAHVDDFAEVLASPLGGWQSRNWDPAVGSNKFYKFCDALTAGTGEDEVAEGATSGEEDVMLGPIKIPIAIVNYAKWIREEVVSKCPADEAGVRDVEDCFGSYDEERYLQTDLDQTWRLWLFQVATQWGYYMPAPLEGKRIISKFLDLDYTMKNGRMAFPPGEHFTVPAFPDVESVNARGDFALAHDRLAFIDGDSDPWRPATPASDYAEVRNDTILRPVRIIKDAVHHFDENGLTDPTAEPKRIRKIHEYEIEFVRSWIQDWHQAKTAGDL